MHNYIVVQIYWHGDRFSATAFATRRCSFAGSDHQSWGRQVFELAASVVAENSKNDEPARAFWSRRHSIAGMLSLISAVVSWLAGRFRIRAELELEVIVLRHQPHRRISFAAT